MNVRMQGQLLGKNFFFSASYKIKAQFPREKNFSSTCYHGWLPGDLKTVKKCCLSIKNDPGHLVFTIRKFCAKANGIQIPTKEEFCECSKSSLKEFANDWDCLNTVMDGCAVNMGDGKICAKMEHSRTVIGFTNLANGLCKNSDAQGMHTMIHLSGVFFAFLHKHEFQNA